MAMGMRKLYRVFSPNQRVTHVSIDSSNDHYKAFVFWKLLNVHEIKITRVKVVIKK